jgi:hypothetical protein
VENLGTLDSYGISPIYTGAQKEIEPKCWQSSPIARVTRSYAVGEGLFTLIRSGVIAIMQQASRHSISFKMWPFRKKTRQEELDEIIKKLFENIATIKKIGYCSPGTYATVTQIGESCIKMQRELDEEKEFNKRYYKKGV